MKKKTLKIIALVVLANLLFFGVIGSCFYFIPFGDGGLGIQGRVYEWVDAPVDAESKIYLADVVLGRDVEPTFHRMQENVASNFLTLPLAGVEIAIGPKDSIEKRGEESYYWITSSDNTGYVDDSWTIAPGKAQFLVKASKLGYKEVVGEVAHVDAINHVVIAVLVPENMAD